MSTASVTAVDTANVSGRRRVRYEKVDDILADAEQLHVGGYRYLGNWTLGTMSAHLAHAMKMGLDGPEAKPIFLARIVGRMLKNRMIHGGQFKPGFKLPKKMAAKLVPPTTDDNAGLDALRTMMRRWKAEPQRHPHPFFGPLTDEEWDLSTLRHAEMHMSFLVPNTK